MNTSYLKGTKYYQNIKSEMNLIPYFCSRFLTKSHILWLSLHYAAKYFDVLMVFLNSNQHWECYSFQMLGWKKSLGKMGTEWYSFGEDRVSWMWGCSQPLVKLWCSPNIQNIGVVNCIFFLWSFKNSTTWEYTLSSEDEKWLLCV